MFPADLKRNELELLFELSPDLHCIATFDGYFSFVNPAFGRVLGYCENELLNKPFIEFVHPNDREATQQAMSQLAYGKTVIAFENRYECADGSFKILQWNASPEKDSKLIAATARDVTQERELQRQLNHHIELRALGTVAATVAHDLRNVLTPVFSVVDVLSAKLNGSDPQIDAAIQLIQSSNQRGADLIDQILLFAEDSPSFHSEVNFEKMANEIVGGITAKNINKSITVKSSHPTVRGDATQLYRVMLNLCNNAVKAMPKGGNLAVVIAEPSEIAGCFKELSETHPDDGLIVQVIDNGIGIPANICEKIFDPFFTTRRGSGGTGLGLAITKKIIHQHDGLIKADSSHGQTTFSIYLPSS